MIEKKIGDVMFQSNEINVIEFNPELYVLHPLRH